MNILILIMGAKVNPAKRNIDAIRNSYIKLYNDNKNKFDNKFEFLFYIGNSKIQKIENDILYCTSKDSVEYTFDKTLEALQYVSKNKNFDYLVRVNISTYINIPLLDEAITHFSPDYIYANQFNAYLTSIKYINDIYPRGDAYIVHKNIIDNVLFLYSDQYITRAKEVIDNYDDTLLGLLYIKHYFNNSKYYFEYYKQLRYSFIPGYIDEVDMNSLTMSFNSIFTRLKTCPKNTEISGFSWKDDKCRLEDVKKFKLINEFILNNMNIIKNIKSKYNLEQILTEQQHRDIPIINFKTNSFVYKEYNEIIDILRKKYYDNEII